MGNEGGNEAKWETEMRTCNNEGKCYSAKGRDGKISGCKRGKVKNGG